MFPLSLPQVSTPGVSASVLLAASYSDNNAIIEGLASYHSYYSQHWPGWEEDIIGDVEKIIFSLSFYCLFTQKISTILIQKYCRYLCSLDLEQDIENNDTRNRLGSVWRK